MHVYKIVLVGDKQIFVFLLYPYYLIKKMWRRGGGAYLRERLN